ncbi:hypothetical protein [Lyngbya aestuarii]|uniref:hypothetical protein n=1 Tax=Lyngbya aestuarii TaxID=118322 RepID=UPI00403DEE6E
MPLNSAYENLYSFLAAEFADADLEGKSDQQVVHNCPTPELVNWHRTILTEGRTALHSSSFPWQKVADYANRHFENEEDVREWLTQILNLLEESVNKI